MSDLRRRPDAKVRIATAAAIDVFLVLAFAAIGRASHGEDPAGLLVTAWPFLVGLAAGWLVTLAWRAPAAPVRTGLGVWAATVAGGVLLRAAAGQGIAFALIVVATVTLLVLLVGWRVIAAVVRRRPRSSLPRSSSHGLAQSRLDDDAVALDDARAVARSGRGGRGDLLGLPHRARLLGRRLVEDVDPEQSA